MRNDVFKSRGLNARILYCRPKSKVGTRHFETPELSEELEKEYHELMHTLLKIPYPEGGIPKEIRLSLNIDIGDFNTKVNQARKFLAKGDKIKVSIRLRGREMAHPELGETNMQRFADELSEEATIDKKPKLEGRQILMFMSPKTK